MTRLLVSVRNQQEAAAALAGGADVIDVKEPARGALGMASARTIAAVQHAVDGARPVSAALGELVEANPIPDTDYFKIGLADAPADWRDRLPASDRFVAVAYADASLVAAPSPREVIDWAIARRVAGVLIDTAVKGEHDLMHWVGPILPQWITAVQAAGLLIALAGSLRGEALSAAAQLQADIIAVRGAACAGDDRNATVEADRVRAVKSAIESHTLHAARRAGRPAQCTALPSMSP